ncbi:hypothetical protein BaRGS_00020150, partial [Batillaria attramentaria]
MLIELCGHNNGGLITSSKQREGILQNTGGNCCAAVALAGNFEQSNQTSRNRIPQCVYRQSGHRVQVTDKRNGQADRLCSTVRQKGRDAMFGCA